MELKLPVKPKFPFSVGLKFENGKPSVETTYKDWNPEQRKQVKEYTKKRNKYRSEMVRLTPKLFNKVISLQERLGGIKKLREDNNKLKRELVKIQKGEKSGLKKALKKIEEGKRLQEEGEKALKV